jgi:hypothetical protein
VELLVMKKQLLTGGKDEVLPAVHAFQYLVLEIHDPVIAKPLNGRRLPPPRKLTEIT